LIEPKSTNNSFHPRSISRKDPYRKSS